jgi:hypothetical protein
MTTTAGSTRADGHTGGRRTHGGNRARRGRRLAAGFAGLALGVTTVAACSSSSPAPTAGAGTTTVTSTTTAPPSPSTTSSSPGTGSTTSPGSGGQPSPTSSNGGAEAPGAPATTGLTACAPSQMRVTVMGAPGGGSAGHEEMQIIATNTGPTQCTLQGYPGVSLTAPGSGAQLGAAADRVPGDAPLMRLEPGKTAVSSILVAQAALYGSSCGTTTTAAGFRIYLPGQTTASFAPSPVSACQPASVHQLSVKPFTA